MRVLSLEPFFKVILGLDTIFNVILRLEPVLQDFFGLDTVFNDISWLEAFRMCFQHLKRPGILKFDKMAKNNVFFLLRSHLFVFRSRQWLENAKNDKKPKFDKMA